MSTSPNSVSPNSEYRIAVSDIQTDAVRQMGVCNACRYCEGLCAVFPAMELRRQLTGPDVDYLANLCHSCGACHFDCQYAEPHEFAIEIPAVMAELREETYARHVWPAVLGPVFARNGLWVATITAISVALFIVGFILLTDASVLFASGSEEGAFYRAMPHNTMAGLFGAVFLYSIVAISLGVRSFWRSTGSQGSVTWRSLWRATSDAGKLRYLDGGGMGCMHESEQPSNSRRIAHHFTFYGFLLCLASTSSGTLMHYVFGVQAPYPWWSPTVVLGTLGGIGLIIGPIGLLRAKREQHNALKAKQSSGMDVAFLYMLLATSITGLLLLVFRATPAMGLLLAVHLGLVFALFITMPYGKFVHGLYRYAALMRHAHEQANSDKV